MNVKLKIALALVWAAGALGAAAPNAIPKPSAPPTPRKAVTAPAKPDAEIEADIKRRFARSKVNEDNFTVKVRSGVATLEGRTNVPQRKGSATRMAKSAGAKQVNNLIQVSEAARQKAAQNFARRRAQVIRGERR
jgi:osmotically-inducible protein OsmY